MLLPGELCVSFHWIKIEWWKPAQLIEYKVYTECVILAFLFKKRQRNNDKWQRWKRERLHFGCWMGRQWNLSWLMDSQSEEIVKSFLLDEIYKISFLNRFSLNPNCLVNIVHWKYHVGLFIHQETKKQGQNNCYEKGKTFTLAVGWEVSELFPEIKFKNKIL